MILLIKIHVQNVAIRQTEYIYIYIRDLFKIFKQVFPLIN